MQETICTFYVAGGDSNNEISFKISENAETS